MLTHHKQRLARKAAALTARHWVRSENPRPRLLPAPLGLLSRFTYFTLQLCDQIAELSDLPLAQEIARCWITELLQHPRHRAPAAIAVPTKLPDAPINPADLDCALQETLELLNHSGLEPFLAFGLLLGCVRQNDYLPNDNDLDLGLLMVPGDTERVRAILTFHGYTILRHEPEPWPCRLKARHPSCEVELDLLFFHSAPPYIQTYTRVCGHPVIRNRHPFSLRAQIFRGIEVRVPDPPETFLTENYGNWRERVPFYDYILSSQLTDFTLPIVHYYFLRTFANAVYMQNAKAIQGLHAIGRKHYPDEAFLQAFASAPAP